MRVTPALGLSCLLTLASCKAAPTKDERSTTVTTQPSSAQTTSATARGDAKVRAISAPPAEIMAAFQLSPFYKKYLDVAGMPFLSSERVSDFALLEADYLARKMIGHRPDLFRAMAARHVRLVVMAPTEMTTDIPEHSSLTPKTYWNRRARGLGSTDEHPAVSAAEENLLDLPGDPYREENIFIHEFAHSIQEAGLMDTDPTFEGRLSAAFAHARANHLWDGTYASTNLHEYWAEVAQSWFDCNRVNDQEHGPINTRYKLKTYDPEVSALLTEVFGDGTWRYEKPSARAPGERAHLAGFDVNTAGKFVWPPSAPPLSDPGTERLLAWLKPSASPRASARTTDTTSIFFENRHRAEVTIDWIDFDGKRTRYAALRPGDSLQQSTYVGHVWVISDGTKPLGAVVATREAGRITIE
jgi:hypothetical protein